MDSHVVDGQSRHIASFARCETTTVSPTCKSADSYAPSVLQMVTPSSNAAKFIIVWNHTRCRVRSNFKRIGFNPEAKRVSMPIVPRFCCDYDADIGTLAWVENCMSRIVLMADWSDAFGSFVTTSTGPTKKMIQLP